MSLLRKANDLSSDPRQTRHGLRICRFEKMEPRRLLAADIHVGAVYFEDGSSHDDVGDLIEITFNGGAPGTQLTDLVIDTDKDSLGLSLGDAFFDTELNPPDGRGAFAAVGLSIVDHAGFDVVGAALSDGGTELAISFTGFDPGEKLVLSVDVDEQGYSPLSSSAVCEGEEFAYSRLTATFDADHHYTATGTDDFLDAYLVGWGLDLPNDQYDPASLYIPPEADPGPVRTAGAFFSIEQTPLPITIAGTVFEDVNLNNVQESGEPGIGGVQLELYLLQDGVYVPTGHTATTAVNSGDYLFEDVAPGTYQVVEAQPADYFSVGATAGTVDGLQRGSVISADEISGVTLLGGEDSIDNDFAEARPASLSGHVYHDADDDGQMDPGEEGIGGVQVLVQRVGPYAPGDWLPGPTTAVTDPTGAWSVDGLMPGEYAVTEIHPDGYLDGKDAAGTVDGVPRGTAHNPGDRIDSIQLLSGQSGEDYDFGELRYASITGQVYVELDGDCNLDPGEPLLSGVRVHLLNASGERIATATTDEDGRYLFSDLPPGVYGVEEIQPEGYLQGCTQPGSAGGNVKVEDVIVGAELGSGVNAVRYNFAELTPSSISGYVFQDGPPLEVTSGEPVPDLAKVRDGRFTSDDTPLAGVELRLADGTGLALLDAAGQPITTKTDASGYYEFTMLMPGEYTVLEVHPQLYIDSIDTPGSHGGLAVNAPDGIDPTILGQLAVDPKNDAILGITLGIGETAASYNFSEVLIKEVPPKDPPKKPPTFVIPPTPTMPAPPPRPVAPPAAPPPTAHYFPVPVSKLVPSLYGGSSAPVGYTWHLSVINAGQPRNDQSGVELMASAYSAYFDAVSWTGADLGQSEWIIADGQGEPVKRIHFGMPGATPVTGDFDGNGATEVGVFVDGVWFVDLNGNGIWDEGDLWARLGHTGDLPVTGDWDGDGKTDIGIFGPAWVGDPRAIEAEPGLPEAFNQPTGRHLNLPPEPGEAAAGWRTMKQTSHGKLRSDLIDHVFHYGSAGDRPVAGDWDGDGVATIGVFRGGTWFLDVDGNGRWSAADVTAEFGAAGDVPVVGDFNGDGADEIGVYRAGTWHLDSNGNRTLDARDKVFQMGTAADKPAVGDFDGDGTDEIAVYSDTAAG